MRPADGRWRRAVAAWWVALGVTAAALLVGAVWWGPAPGLPGLAAAAAGARHLADDLAPLAPGWLPASLVQGLMALGLGPVGAVRIVWTLGALGTLAALSLVLRALGRDLRLLLLASPLVYAGALGRGDLGAALGTALVFAAVGAGLAYVRRGGPPALVALGAALLAAFSTHEALFLAAWGTSALLLLAAPDGAHRGGAAPAAVRAMVAIVATLPALALWTAWRFGLSHVAGAPVLALAFDAGPPEALGPLGAAGWFAREGFDFLTREYDGTALWMMGGLWLLLAAAPASAGLGPATGDAGPQPSTPPPWRAWFGEAAPGLAALGLAAVATWQAPDLSTAGALVAPTLLWLVVSLRPERGGALAGLALGLAGPLALWFGGVAVLSAQRFERREVAPMVQALAAALPAPGGLGSGDGHPRVACVGCERASAVYRRGPLPAVFEALALDLGGAARASGRAGRGTPGALPKRGWQVGESLAWWDAVVVLGRHLAPPDAFAVRLDGAEARTSWDTAWAAYRPRRRASAARGDGAPGDVARSSHRPPRGDDGAPAPREAPAPRPEERAVVETGLQGGSGGTPHRWDCPERMALVALRGARSADRKRVASLVPVCRRLHRYGKTLRPFGSEVTGPALGRAPRGGAPVRVRCADADAQLLVGLDGWAGLVVERLEAVCVGLEGRAGAWREAARGDSPSGDGEGWRRRAANEVHLRCGPGRVAVGVFARSGAEVDAVGLRCADAAALVSPPAPKAARFPGRAYGWGDLLP